MTALAARTNGKQRGASETAPSGNLGRPEVLREVMRLGLASMGVSVIDILPDSTVQGPEPHVEGRAPDGQGSRSGDESGGVAQVILAVVPNHTEYWGAPDSGVQENVTEVPSIVLPGTGMIMWKLASV